jgi:hypothetical protein
MRENLRELNIDGMRYVNEDNKLNPGFVRVRGTLGYINIG